MRRRATRPSIPSIRTSARRGDSAGQEIERFESLVGKLSAAMARIPADAVDSEVDTWLGKICLALDLDRSAIYERDAPGREVRASHTWLRANFPPFPRKYDPERLFKKTTDWVMSGNRFVFSSPSEIPVELGDAKQFVERYGPKASAVIPIWAGGRVIGAASFGRFRSTRQWRSQLLDQLALAVQIFGAAIERKQAEAAAREARAELQLAQRRSMMGELVASLAHELNQPLGAVLSNLGGLGRLVSQSNPDPAVTTRVVNNAIEDTKRAAEIVRRIRTLFKGDGAKKVPIEIGALVSEVVALIGSEAALRKTPIQIEVSRSITSVLGDRILLQQCVLNLLMNAFDACADAPSDRRKVTIKLAREQQGWTAISVCDTGGGIHPSVAGRVFEPFVTTKSNGMGLGLLVTRSIVEEHGGRIWSEPNEEGGTTFTFTVPEVKKKNINRSRRARRKVDG